MDSFDRAKGRLEAIWKLMGDERAPAGEREAARLAINRLAFKHKLSMNDVEEMFHEETTTIVYFRAATAIERALLTQIISRVADSVSFSSWRKSGGTGSRSEVGYQLTRVQAIDVREMYEFYLAHLNAEMDELFNAFVQKHRLFCTTPSEHHERLSRDEALELQRRMDALRDLEFNPRLVASVGGA